MAYSEDLRKRVRAYIAAGGKQSEACKLFGICRDTIYRWVNDPTAAQTPGPKGPRKLDEQALLEDVRLYPDKLLRERAQDFNMSINGIWVALKRLEVKKNTRIR